MDHPSSKWRSYGRPLEGNHKRDPSVKEQQCVSGGGRQQGQIPGGY